MLKAHGLGHRFGDRLLFRHVDVSLEPGDALFVEGPSGAGKSTLLLILGDLIVPTEGFVERSEAGGVAWITQDMNGLPSRKVMDNARLYALVDGEPFGVADAKARRALDAVGLAHVAGSRARALSGGENQRLCVARALACDRTLLLADEPTSQLDRDNAHVVMSQLAAAAQDGRTVVVVTHDVEALPSTATVARLTQEGLALAVPRRERY